MKKITRLEANVKVYEEQFHKLGSDEGFKLVTDGPRDFVFFATGRIHCESLYAQIKCRSRHDYIMQTIDEYQNIPTHDRVTITVNLNDLEVDPICFAFLAKTDSKRILKERWDLDNFSKQFSLQSFPKDAYQVRSDNQEFIAKLWQLTSLKKTLWKSIGLTEKGVQIKQKGYEASVMKPIIEQITLSDLPWFKPEKIEGLVVPKQLSFVFRIPEEILELPPSLLEFQTELTNLILEITDFVAMNGKLPQDQFQRARVLREQALLSIMKEGEEERKKSLADKKFAEQKQKLEKMSPESQRKAEEKMKKKELKKNLNSKNKRM
jgi:hypothetical protein